MPRIPYHHFLNVRSAGGASASVGGRRVVFLTDVTGTSQLWSLERALGWPEQLTFYEDRLLWASHSPTDDVVAFGKDTGGDEQTLIHRIDAAGGVPERVSPTDAKHMWGGWRRDGQRMAWSHNGRNGRDFDLFVFDPATGREAVVFEGEGMWYVAAWLPDGSGLVIGRADSNANNDLFLLDLDRGGAPRLLTPHEGDAFFASPCPSPDGQRLHLLANADRDRTSLAVIDLATGAFEYLDESEWERSGLALDESGRHLVVETNVEGYTEIEVRDLETGAVRAIDSFGRATAGGSRFVRGTDRFTLTVVGPTDSADIWMIDATTGEAERWTRSSLAGIPRGGLVEPELIHFESFDGLSVPAFYYRPPGVRGKVPVLIDIHGGPESQRRPVFAPTQQYLLQEGLAILSPNVRGSTGYGKAYMALDDKRRRMDSVADIKAAHAWLVAEGGADPDRIALMGGSYGGFMVLASMVEYPDLWAAGVDVVGIASFVTFLENTSAYRRHLREAEYGSLEEDRDFLHQISPLTRIDRIAAPLMVIHGANDPRVPVSEAEQVVAAVRSHGLPVESIIYEDEGHGLAKRANRLDAYPRVARFLATHLGLEAPE